MARLVRRPLPARRSPGPSAETGNSGKAAAANSGVAEGSASVSRKECSPGTGSRRAAAGERGRAAGPRRSEEGCPLGERETAAGRAGGRGPGAQPAPPRKRTGPRSPARPIVQPSRGGSPGASSQERGPRPDSAPPRLPELRRFGPVGSARQFYDQCRPRGVPNSRPHGREALQRAAKMGGSWESLLPAHKRGESSIDGLESDPSCHGAMWCVQEPDLVAIQRRPLRDVHTQLARKRGGRRPHVPAPACAPPNPPVGSFRLSAPPLPRPRPQHTSALLAARGRGRGREAGRGCRPDAAARTQPRLSGPSLLTPPPRRGATTPSDAPRRKRSPLPLPRCPWPSGSPPSAPVRRPT
nr:WAS/WASL-interacting protein family member 1-like [Camelus dromedarius]